MEVVAMNGRTRSLWRRWRLSRLVSRDERARRAALADVAARAAQKDRDRALERRMQAGRWLI